MRPSHFILKSVPPSSRGLGHQPFKLGTGIRIPLGAPTTLSSLPLFYLFNPHRPGGVAARDVVGIQSFAPHLVQKLDSSSIGVPHSAQKLDSEPCNAAEAVFFAVARVFFSFAAPVGITRMASLELPIRVLDMRGPAGAVAMIPSRDDLRRRKRKTMPATARAAKHITKIGIV